MIDKSDILIPFGPGVVEIMLFRLLLLLRGLGNHTKNNHKGKNNNPRLDDKASNIGSKHYEGRKRSWRANNELQTVAMETQNN